MSAGCGALTVRELHMQTDHARHTRTGRSLKDFKKQLRTQLDGTGSSNQIRQAEVPVLSMSPTPISRMSRWKPAPLMQLLREPETVLRPELNIKEAADLF